MSSRRKLKIVVVSGFYSEGMGYTENSLPKALAALGHEVHLVTSVFNVYGNAPDYERTYGAFLGPRTVAAGSSVVDGYQVHRLETRLLGGYVKLRGLTRRIREIGPDVVHALEIASLEAFELAVMKPALGYALFAETHQHMSVMRPFLKAPRSPVRKAAYRLTRTLPTYLASLAVSRCYAIAPDCVEVATRFYGVSEAKMKLQSLGSDTDLYRPAETAADRAARDELRSALGFAEQDIVCLYSGRFSRDKNPLLLARAIDLLAEVDPRFKGVFVGEGVQREEIARCRNIRIVPFMKQRDLAAHYRASDVAVWPTQESMSMLDAASSGLPLVVSDRVGESERVNGNGRMYEEGLVESMVTVLRSLADADERAALGAAGRRKMVEGFSWTRLARAIEADFLGVLGPSQASSVASNGAGPHGGEGRTRIGPGTKTLLRGLRILAKQAVGVEPIVRAVGTPALEFHGNAAGGWCILADSLGPDAVVVDVGLGEDASFPESIIAKYGCVVNGFDPTPRAIQYVRGLRNDRLRLHEYGIGAVSGPVKFYLPRQTAHVSGAIAREEHLGVEPIEVQLRTIGQIFEMIGATRVALLKLDVEGAEYDVFSSPEFHRYAPAIDQICVEFHHRWKSRGKGSTLAAVTTLRELGFECAWRSRTTNEEFLFVRRTIAVPSLDGRDARHPE